MPYMLVIHKSENFNKWKPVYDEHEIVRKNSGSKGAVLFKDQDDPNEIVLLFEWDTIEHAKKFASSPDLKETMQRAGVIEIPKIYFLDEVKKSKA